MIIAVAKIRLYAPWVNSLKEKRMIVKSLTAKVRSRFNVSVAETEEQDVHRTIVLAVACVAGGISQADSMMEHVLSFMERNTEAEIIKVDREIR